MIQELHHESSKPTLVFLHYFGGAAASWRWVFQSLSKDFDCVAIDFPGFGGSPPLEKPTIKAFAEYVRNEIQRLSIQNYILIGHSMGGKIAIEVAANAGKDVVQQLILVAPSPPDFEPMPEEEKKRMLKHPDLEEARTTVQNACKITLAAKQFQLAIHTQMIANPKSWDWWLQEGMNHSVEREASTLNMPITVISSKDDPVIKPKTIQSQVLRILNTAKWVEGKEIGHLIPLEAPEWLAQQIELIVKQKMKQNE